MRNAECGMRNEKTERPNALSSAFSIPHSAFPYDANEYRITGTAAQRSRRITPSRIRNEIGSISQPEYSWNCSPAFCDRYPYTNALGTIRTTLHRIALTGLASRTMNRTEF